MTYKRNKIALIGAGQIGGIMNAEKIALSIIRTTAEISQGFKTVQITTKKGAAHIVRPPENVSSALETPFPSYLTEPLSGQSRASVRTSGLCPFRGVKSCAKTTCFISFNLFRRCSGFRTGLGAAFGPIIYWAWFSNARAIREFNLMNN